MAVLIVMVSISLEMVTRVSGAFRANAAAGALMGSDFTDGMTSQAMQQGGMGLILTTLIVTTPPMAAAFFQGTLGEFSPDVAFAAGGASASNGYPPGQGPVQNMGYTPASPLAPAMATASPNNGQAVMRRNAETSSSPSTGRMGVASTTRAGPFE